MNPNRRPPRVFALHFVLPVALLSGAALGGCCSSLQDLEPAFETNQQNIRELGANTVALPSLVESLGNALYVSEINDRRGRVLHELVILRAETKPPGAAARVSFDEWSRTGAGTMANMYRRLQVALSVSEEANKRRLRAANPVLSGLVALDPTPESVWADLDALDGVTPKEIASLGSKLGDKYGPVRDAIAKREKFEAQMKAYNTVVENQLRLAIAHSELFVYCAKTNADISKLVGGVVGNEQLQGSVLELIKSDKGKETAKEAFDLLHELLDSHETETPQ